MSLILDTQHLMEEVRADEKARDQRLEGVLELVRRYPGTWWEGPPAPGGEPESENAIFEFCAFAIGQLVWKNPRWRSSTRRPRAQQMVAHAIQFGMNRWSVDTNIKTVLTDLAYDYLFGWCMGHVTETPVPESYESEDPMLWPQVSRLSPLSVGWDHRAPTFRRARLVHHEYTIDKDDLLEQAYRDKELPRGQRQGWRESAIKELTELDQREGRSKELWGSGLWDDGPDRHQVRVKCLWLPGVQLPNKPGPAEGFHGTLVTLGVSGGKGTEAVELRPPRPFFGPRWGPYTMIGTYVVPDNPFPLSVLLGGAANIEAASRLAAAVDRQVEAYKRILLAGAGDPTLGRLIKDSKNDHVYQTRVALRDMENLLATFEYGGTNPANLQAEARSLLKRDRILGMDDVQRGRVSGRGTAHEVERAVEGSQNRFATVQGRWEDGVTQIGRTVAWYLYHNDTLQFPLGPEAVEALGLDPELDEPFFEGGTFEEGSGATFDDLGLELEPYSLGQQSDAVLQQRGQLIMTTLQLLPAIAQAQQVGGDVKALLDALGDSFGWPRYSSLFPGIQSADLSVLLPEQAEPRLSRDIGALGVIRGLAAGGGSMGPGRGSMLSGVPGGGGADESVFAGIG